MVEFRILGELEVRVDGAPVDIGYARLRSALAILLVEANNVVSADQIAHRLWADSMPDKARDTVSSYVYRLRRLLADVPDVAIETRPGGYVLAIDPSTVDLQRFRRLIGDARAAADERALALYDEAFGLWRGTALATVDGAWLTAVRDRLHAERFAAELDHADLRLALGQHAELVAGLAVAAADHPFDERIAAQLMMALYRSGRAADALEHYRRTRQNLSDQIGTEPGSELRELHQRMLATDPTLLLPAAGASGPTIARVPRQLPAPPHVFVGRDAEFAALTGDWAARTTGSTLLISAISGLGGIGKTWLALRWAHEMADRFPDGQLFVNLRGFDPAAPPMSPATAVRGFLDALGVPAGDIPVDLDAQVGLYRSLLADRRMLVVLDNARDAAQVVPLLPGSPTCTVLVTSRSQLYGLVSAHGARPTALDTLSDTESRDLFDRLVGRARTAAEPAATAELVAVCAGLPLAVGIIAARATTQPDIPLAHLAGEMRDPVTRLDGFDTGDLTADMRAVFGCSFRALDDTTSGLLGLLSLAPGPDIGLTAVAALAAVSPTTARALLRRLVSAHLVTQVPGDRYRMHDLTRRYAMEQAESGLPATDRVAAEHRLVDFYLHTAYAGERLLYPQRGLMQLDPPAPGCEPLAPADLDAAMTWFDTEYACVMAAIQLAVEREWHGAVWRFGWALDGFRYRRGLVHDSLAGWRVAIEAARRLGDPAVEARAQRLLGMAYFRVAMMDEATAHLRQALALDESTGDRNGQAATHHNLGLVLDSLGDVAGALDHSEQALELYRILGNQALEADALAAAGWLYAQLARYTEAIERCEQALQRYQARDDLPSEGAVLDTLGYVHHRLGDHDEAVRCFERSLAAFRSVDNAYEEANTLANLAEPLLARGEVAEAGTTLRRALDLYRDQGRIAEADAVLERLSRADITG